MRSRMAGLGVAGVVAYALGGGGLGWAQDVPLPRAFTHQHFNTLQGTGSPAGGGTLGLSTYSNVKGPICRTGSTASNVNTDCEGVGAHNETSIAVNPSHPSNIIGSANDYQLRVSSGGQINESVFSRAHVSFNGGATWTTYPVPFKSYNATGDPSVAFDASGTAYIATLGFRFSQGASGSVPAPDILVSHSTDRGKSWSTPSVVSPGSGNSNSPGVFNDKEYVTAWGNGNAIVTWTQFNDGRKGSYISSPIYASVTHNGGMTWSPKALISGSAAFCVGSSGDTACDQDQGSIPTVAADGSVYVAFESTANTTDFSDQYLVVKVDPATGQRIAGPFKVATLVDGVTAYPFDAEGRQTYQDSQFRTWSLGNITADPTNRLHLAVVWSDMRNSPQPAPADPYAGTTNSDLVVSQSFDGGQTWSAPVALTRLHDQFMPWATYDTGGHLRIGFFDRAYDPANHAYGYTLATESSPGSLSFTFTQVTTRRSDPTHADRWFSSFTANPAFPNPTAFLGDYSNIAALPTGGVVAYWTDMRNQVSLLGRTGAGEDAYFARQP
jgi:hypothetical protein